MLISEVNTDDVSVEAVGAFERLSHLVSELEAHSTKVSLNDIAQEIRQIVTTLPSELSEHQRLLLWKLSYRIWNTSVDITNNLGTGEKLTEVHVRLRHAAAEMLLTAGENPNVRSSLLKMAMFFTRTGSLWHQLKNYEMAEACFSQATELCAHAREETSGVAGGLGSTESNESLQLSFDIYTSRARTAWELSQRALACNLLGRANSLISSLPEKCAELAEHYLFYGRSLLSKPGDTEAASESVTYLEQAFEICSGALRSTSAADCKDQLNSLKLRCLRYLAGAHVQNQHHDAALKCIASLKATSDHASIPYLELKALAGLGRFEEAEKQLNALVSHEGCTVELGAAGIEAMLTSDHSDAVNCTKKAFFLMHHRFPKHSKLPVLVLEKMLSKNSTAEHIEAALEIAQKEEVSSLLRAAKGDGASGASQEQQCVFALLWNAGSETFQAKDYALSRKLFEATMLYLPSSHSATVQRAKALRVICLCHLATQQLDQAQECVNLAEQLDPTIATAFLKFKIFLQMNCADEASKQVEKMLACRDFDPEYLTLASHEAISCECVNVAVAALSKLQQLISTGQTTGTREIVVLRNLISLTAEQTGNTTAGLKYFQQTQARLAESGFEGCFGEGSMGRKEAVWFAGMAWNYGLEAGKRRDWATCIAFLLCAADFFAAIPESPDTLQSQKRSLILAAAAVLSPEGSLDDKGLKTASTCLDRCRKVLALQASRPELASNDEGSPVYFNLLMFDLKGRTRDTNGQMEVLNRCKSLPGFAAVQFLRMAMNAGEREGGNTEVATAALRSCLNRLLSSASPDYAVAAAVVRKLIRLADLQDKDGPQVLDLYKEAEKMLVGLPLGAYPKDELHWLVSTAWNRAPLHAKFRRYDEAEHWMKVALDLLKHAPGLEMHKTMMTEALKEVLESKGKVMAMEE